MLSIKNIFEQLKKYIYHRQGAGLHDHCDGGLYEEHGGWRIPTRLAGCSEVLRLATLSGQLNGVATASRVRIRTVKNPHSRYCSSKRHYKLSAEVETKQNKNVLINGKIINIIMFLKKWTIGFFESFSAKIIIFT